MSEIKISNLVRCVLSDSGGVDTDDTTINVALVTGAFPTLGAGDWFRAVIIRASDLAKEFVKVTAVSGSGPYALTVVRAEENSTALAFLQGDALELRFTAQTFLDYRSAIDSLVAAANAAAASAVAAAENANTLAAQALASIDAAFPITDEADIANNLIKPVHLHTSVAGVALGGGGGLALDVLYDSAKLAVNGSNQLSIKTQSIAPSDMVAGLVMRYKAVASIGTGTSHFYTGSVPAPTVFGNSGSVARMVYAVLTNDHASDQAVVTLHIGGTLNNFIGATPSDAGFPVLTVAIPREGFFAASKKVYIPISFLVPPGHRWIFEHNTPSEGTPNIISHTMFDWY